jgi:hypothetical protein
LLAVARLLTTTAERAALTDAQLRRAVSTAYYAVFHRVLKAAAERFMGQDQTKTAGYAWLYRGFDHRTMRTVCEALQVPTLRDKYRRGLDRSAVSRDMQDFATNFGVLQDARQLADYDPAAEFLPASVASLIDVAAAAIDASERTAADEQADVLALMLVGARG